jgi:hypothetical protein|tara:strand:+ start:1035 stop:1262 length:228 start_codon:yes stop_codon:yes gene_type:complete
MNDFKKIEKKTKMDSKNEDWRTIYEELPISDLIKNNLHLSQKGECEKFIKKNLTNSEISKIRDLLCKYPIKKRKK